MAKRYRGCDLRKGRFSESRRIYLITTVTRDRRRVFGDWRCGRHVVRSLIGERNRADTLAYVVMPDHLHWLLQLAPGASLPDVVQTVKGVSSHRINHFLQRRGAVWQAGYHDHALRDEEDIVGVARYIVANPLRAGLVRRLGDYPLWDAVWL